MQLTKWMTIQTGLIEEILEWFNGKIHDHQDDGHIDTYKQGKYFQQKIVDIIKKYFSEKEILVDASSGSLIDKYGKKRKINLILKRSDGKEVAFIQVASYGDKTGYRMFREKLSDCGVLNQGFFIAICGQAKLDLVNGENRDVDPKIYFLGKSKWGSVKFKKLMNEPEVYMNVLEHFLKDLEDSVKSKD